MEHRLRQSVGGCILGFALGLLAWEEGRAPVLALALPLAIVFSRSRLQAFGVGSGYAAGVLRHAVEFIASWFGHHLAVGIAAVSAYAAATGAIWCLGWSGSPSVARRALAISAAWLLALLAGIAVPGHPLIAAGYLLPGSGWAGAVAAWLLPAAAVCAGTWRGFASLTARRAASASALVVLAVAGLRLAPTAPSDVVGSVQAEQTRWGPLRGEADALLRMQRMGAAIVHPGARTIVWPESILGRFDPASAPVLELELLRAARRAGRTQIIGVDLPLPRNRLLNAAVAFRPDGRTAIAFARQPAPLSLWRPWRDHDTFVADWRARNVLDLGPEGRAAVIFCYEEYGPIFYLLNEAFDRPTLYLALANTWAAESPAAAAIQTLHSRGMAGLFGRPYLKAENRPAA